LELKHTARKGGRLSSVLKEEMGMSTGLMNRLKWKQLLFVNGIPRHTDYAVAPGDTVTVLLEEPAAEYPAQDGPLSILYEDAHILAVDKPAGMLIHPSTSVFTGTLANYVLGYYRRTGQQSVFHPVTRLDRDTFGVVLLGKNSHIHALLNDLHRKGQLQKTYYALTWGGPEDEEGFIDAPIARKPLPSLLRQVHPDGKPSRTQYRVLERQGQLCHLALQPITGRTHQLRVHCAYMGFPILGDPQYGTGASLEYSRLLGLEGQQLCAGMLEFIHPVTGESVTVRSQLTVSPASVLQNQPRVAVSLRQNPPL